MTGLSPATCQKPKLSTVEQDGYIVTNAHVLEKADEITVAFNDGRKSRAKLIGTDPDSDLAVIKIELDKLPVLPFKLSGNEVGDVSLRLVILLG